MVNYEAKHAKALKKVQNGGAPVTFTKTVPGSYDPVTQEHTQPSEITVSGSAVEIPGDPEEYAASDLIPRNPVTLIFVPAERGQELEQNMVCEWAGLNRSVFQRFPIRPDGVVIATRVILV